MSAYLAALGLTVLIEVPCYGITLTRWGRRPWREALIAGVVVNLVSHPLAFGAVYPLLKSPLGSAAALVLTEIAVMLGEAALLTWRGVRSTVAVGASATANVVSLVIGVWLIG